MSGMPASYFWTLERGRTSNVLLGLAGVAEVVVAFPANNERTAGAFAHRADDVRHAVIALQDLALLNAHHLGRAPAGD